MVDIAAKINLNSYNPDQYTNWDELRVCPGSKNDR